MIIQSDNLKPAVFTVAPDTKKARKDFLDDVARIVEEVGGGLQFKPSPSSETFLNRNSLERTILGEGYLVSADKAGVVAKMMGKKLDSVTLKNLLKVSLDAAGVDSSYVHCTAEGVWIGAGTIDALIDTINNSEDTVMTHPSSVLVEAKEKAAFLDTLIKGLVPEQNLFR